MGPPPSLSPSKTSSCISLGYLPQLDGNMSSSSLSSCSNMSSEDSFSPEFDGKMSSSSLSSCSNISSEDSLAPESDGKMPSSSLSSCSSMSSEESLSTEPDHSSTSVTIILKSLEKSWFSQSSENETSQQLPNSENKIPVIYGYRPIKPHIARQPSARRTIRRENKCVEALSLPIISSYNMRSIWGKLKCFSDDMHERGKILYIRRKLKKCWN